MRSVPRRTSAYLALATGCALVVAGCASAGSGDGETAKEGERSPSASSSAAPSNPFEFTAATVAGGDLNGTDLMGQDVILWFWAPWCPTCMVEGKEEVADAIAALPEGVQLVGVAGRSDDQEAMEEFLEWTGTGDATHVADTTGEIWAGFGVQLQPAFLFVNDDGTAQRGGAGLNTDDILEHAERLAQS